MKYSLSEVLNALKIESNPNAAQDFAGLVILIIAFVLLSILVKNFTTVLRLKMNWELYRFLIYYKNMSYREMELLRKVMVKQEIKEKYEIFILEGVFDKYVDREIMRIESSYSSIGKKENEIKRLHDIRIKLFGSLKHNRSLGDNSGKNEKKN